MTQILRVSAQHLLYTAMFQLGRSYRSSKQREIPVSTKRTTPATSRHIANTNGVKRTDRKLLAVERAYGESSGVWRERALCSHRKGMERALCSDRKCERRGRFISRSGPFRERVSLRGLCLQYFGIK